MDRKLLSRSAVLHIEKAAEQTHALEVSALILVVSTLC